MDNERYELIEETMHSLTSDCVDYGMRCAIARMEEYGIINEKMASWLRSLMKIEGGFSECYKSEESERINAKTHEAIRLFAEMAGISAEEYF